MILVLVMYASAEQRDNRHTYKLLIAILLTPAGSEVIITTTNSSPLTCQ